MSAAVDEVMEKLKAMTLLEASELVKAIEETFDVDASAARSVRGVAGAYGVLQGVCMSVSGVAGGFLELRLRQRVHHAPGHRL